MGNYPYCKQKVYLDDVKNETDRSGFLKQEIMYKCVRTVKTYLGPAETNTTETLR